MLHCHLVQHLVQLYQQSRVDFEALTRFEEILFSLLHYHSSFMFQISKVTWKPTTLNLVSQPSSIFTSFPHGANVSFILIRQNTFTCLIFLCPTKNFHCGMFPHFKNIIYMFVPFLIYPNFHLE